MPILPLLQILPLHIDTSKTEIKETIRASNAVSLSVLDLESPTAKRKRSLTKLDEYIHTNTKILKTGEQSRDSTETVKPGPLDLTSNPDQRISFQNQLHTEHESSPTVSTQPAPQTHTEQKESTPRTLLISKPPSESRQLLTNITSRVPSFDGTSLLNSQQVPTRSEPRYQVPVTVPPLHRERSRVPVLDNRGVSLNDTTPSKPQHSISSVAKTVVLHPGPAPEEDSFLIPTLKPMALQRARTTIVSLFLTFIFFFSCDCLCFTEYDVPGCRGMVGRGLFHLRMMTNSSPKRAGRDSINMTAVLISLLQINSFSFEHSVPPKSQPPGLQILFWSQLS